jgi:hypothetical protein
MSTGCEECLFVSKATKGRMRLCSPCAGTVTPSKKVVTQAERDRGGRSGRASSSNNNGIFRNNTVRMKGVSENHGGRKDNDN